MADSTKKPRALVTGASGFLATKIILLLLDRGYQVVGALRSAEKADAWRRLYPQYSSGEAGQHQMEFAIVPDMQLDGAYDEAVRGVDVVFHTASPFFFTFEDNERDMLVPARKGALSVLESAMRAPRVQRVVFTSS